jgi:hypothetical protein
MGSFKRVASQVALSAVAPLAVIILILSEASQAVKKTITPARIAPVP